MCLSLGFHSDKPYNRSKYRYKKVTTRGGGVYGYYRFYCYHPTKWMTCSQSISGDICNHGFHVLIERPTAYYRKYWAYIKVEVKGFRASGFFGGDKSETWTHMRIKKIFRPKT